MEIIAAVVCFILIFAGQSFLYRKFWNAGLELQIGFAEPYLEIGTVSHITEEISNQKKLPLPVLHVKFSTDRSLAFTEHENASVTDLYHRNDALSVMGNEKVTRTLEFVPQKRGLFFLSGIRVVAKDFLMSHTFAMSVESNSYVYVLPKKTDSPELQILLNNMVGDMQAKKSPMPDPFAFYGVRPYTTGDEMKTINWKLTARQDELMVNVYEPTSEQKVKIFICLEPQAMIKVDYMRELCISLASGAVTYLIDRRVPVSICAAAKDVLSGEIETVDFGASPAHRITADKYLSRISEACGMDEFLDLLRKEHEREQGYAAYLIISSYCKEDLLSCLDRMEKHGRQICMISPYLDIQGCEASREYLHGWEVVLDDI